MESAAASGSCQLAAPRGRLYLRGVPLLPDSLRGRAATLDTDPFRYLRGVLGFLLGGGTVVALLLALTGVGAQALLLAGVLWSLYGLAFGLVDAVVEPLIDLANHALSNVGLMRAGGGYSAEETLVAEGHHDAAAEAYLERARVPRDRAEAMIRRAEQIAGPLGRPADAAAELEALQQDADHLRPRDDMRLGLALAELYEQKLGDPGRAMGEVRRLIDRYPHLRGTRELRGLLAALRAQHFSPAETTP
jgi:tetratricopeptide (TPR) repeat protein